MVRPALGLLAIAACLCAPVLAQGHGGGSPGGGGPGGGQPVGGFGAMSHQPLADRTVPMPQAGKQRGAAESIPAGRWWDDKNFARTLGIAPPQQQRMDDVFAANRDSLMRAYKTLQHEESQLQKLTRSGGVDENLVFQQIDRVTMARGELEKANAHMVLQIRRELTPEQMARLDGYGATQ